MVSNWTRVCLLKSTEWDDIVLAQGGRFRRGSICMTDSVKWLQSGCRKACTRPIRPSVCLGICLQLLAKKAGWRFRWVDSSMAISRADVRRDASGSLVQVMVDLGRRCDYRSQESWFESVMGPESE